MTSRRRPSSSAQSSGSGDVYVTVRIERAFGDRFDEIVASLKKRGLRDVQSHKRFLLLNGSIPSERLDELRSVDGVASVRVDETYGTR